VLPTLVWVSLTVIACAREATAEQSTPFKKVKWRLHAIEKVSKGRIENYERVWAHV
jgi:hypothetical protein